MQKIDTTQHEKTTNPASVSSEKKPFIAPKLEKMDIALTEASFTTPGGADMGMYSS